MNGDSSEAHEEGSVPETLNTRNAVCEAIYIRDNEGNGPGHWHFTQKYDEGRIARF
jgi:hypothetical protein